MSKIGFGVLYNVVYDLFPINVPFTCFYIKSFTNCLQRFTSSVQTTNLIEPKILTEHVLYFGSTNIQKKSKT